VLLVEGVVVFSDASDVVSNIEADEIVDKTEVTFDDSVVAVVVVVVVVGVVVVKVVVVVVVFPAISSPASPEPYEKTSDKHLTIKHPQGGCVMDSTNLPPGPRHSPPPNTEVK
jgi:hypothetical protein